MLKLPLLRVRRALRTALLLTVAGCDAGATFSGCWMPQITFSGLDAGAQTQTTSAIVPAAPRTDDRATADQGASPDEGASTSGAPSSTAPQPLYNRIPAFPEAPPAPPPPQSTIVYYVPATAAPGAPGAPAAQAPEGAPGEVSSEGTPNGEMSPTPEVVAIPFDVDSRRIAPEGSAMVMPGVRPPVPPGPEPPPAQGSQQQQPPQPPTVLPGPRPQPGPMNFRVPPPPPPGPPAP